MRTRYAEERNKLYLMREDCKAELLAAGPSALIIREERDQVAGQAIGHCLSRFTCASKQTSTSAMPPSRTEPWCARSMVTCCVFAALMILASPWTSAWTGRWGASHT